MAFVGLERARFGISMFPTDFAIQPARLAREVEDRGFDSLFFPEHTHIPTSRKTPFPGGGDLPQDYWRSHDPLVALAACAASTERIRLGTGVCLLIERDPITTAKAIASLDVISNGRVVLGVGAGWNREEMENHGANYTHRWEILREKVCAMQTIWSEDEPEYHGKHVDFDPLWSWPKPIQEGGPRIWIGANSKWVFDRIADYAHGWMPIGGMGSGNMDRLKEALEKRNRRIGDIDLVLFGAIPDPALIKGRIDQGFDEVVLTVPAGTAEDVLPVLDRYAEIVRQVKG